MLLKGWGSVGLVYIVPTARNDTTLLDIIYQHVLNTLNLVLPEIFITLLLVRTEKRPTSAKLIK